MPIVLTLLYRNDCTQIKFVDDKLEIVFCYFIWLEDKNFNNIPIDFNEKNLIQNANSSNSSASNSNLNSNKYSIDADNFMFKKSKLANVFKDHGKYCSFGITNVSYFDILKAICYPAAPDESLTCYELVCVYSNKTAPNLIDAQLNFLYNYITRNVQDFAY
jgi:hypothetical protein